MKKTEQPYKVYYTHKQSSLEKGLRDKLKEIVGLINTLDFTKEEHKKLVSLSNEAFAGIDTYFDIVEIVQRSPHPRKKQEYLTIRFIKKDITVDIDTETFERFYMPVQFQSSYAPVKIKKALYYA